MQFKLVSKDHGFDDFDVLNHPIIKRVCVPHSIRHGERFNVYCVEGVKLGAVWRGTVDRSMEGFVRDIKERAATNR